MALSSSNLINHFLLAVDIFLTQIKVDRDKMKLTRFGKSCDNCCKYDEIIVSD